jgi:hypothetical protein
MMTRILALDLRSLALLRIGVGTLLLYDLLGRLGDLTEYYTDAGVLPRALLTKEYWNPAWWSIHLFSGHASGQALLFALHALAALALVLGWRTRAASWACYLLTLSLHNRNPLILDASDRLFLILMFWGLFIPWESRFSLDARANPQWAEGSNAVVLPGGAGYLIQICIAYLVPAFWKLHPVWITERSALYRTFELDQFTKPLGRWLMNFPSLLEVLTLGAFLIEWVAPFLLLLGNGRARLAGVGLLVLLQVGIAMTMDLEFFPLVCLVSLLGCLPSTYWSEKVEPPQFVSSCRWATSALTTALAALAVALVLIWNGLVLANERKPPSDPSPLTVVLSALRLTQFWDLFSPVPRPVDSRFFVEARLADGATVDLLRSGRPLSSAEVAYPYREFKNQRQRIYLSSLEWSVRGPILMRYLRRQAVAWEEANPDRPVLWTRLLSVRKQTRFDDPGRYPQLFDLGWAVSPRTSWQGPLPPREGATEAANR